MPPAVCWHRGWHGPSHLHVPFFLFPSWTPGISINSDYLDRGISFSQSTLKGGWKVGRTRSVQLAMLVRQAYKQAGALSSPAGAPDPRPRHALAKLPIHPLHRQVLVLADDASKQYWVFLDAFDLQLWLAIILTCILVGVVVWALDRWAWIRPPPRGLPDLPDLPTRVWTALGRPMQVGASWLEEIKKFEIIER